MNPIKIVITSILVGLLAYNTASQAIEDAQASQMDRACRAGVQEMCK